MMCFLIGNSGCGKSSLIKSALMQQLTKRSRIDLDFLGQKVHVETRAKSFSVKLSLPQERPCREEPSQCRNENVFTASGGAIMVTAETTADTANTGIEANGANDGGGGNDGGEGEGDSGDAEPPLPGLILILIVLAALLSPPTRQALLFIASNVFSLPGAAGGFLWSLYIFRRGPHRNFKRRMACDVIGGSILAHFLPLPFLNFPAETNQFLVGMCWPKLVAALSARIVHMGRSPTNFKASG